MVRNSIQIQRQTAVSNNTKGQTAPKVTNKKPAAPVVNPKNNQPAKNPAELAMDRVKKVYKEKGFWAAARQYINEAFVGPPVNADKEVHEAYRAQDAYIDYLSRF